MIKLLGTASDAIMAVRVDRKFFYFQKVGCEAKKAGNQGVKRKNKKLDFCRRKDLF